MGRRSLSRFWRFCRAALGSFAVAVALFLLAAWIGSSVARNGDWREPDAGIEIMVATNGVHTALVLPAVTPTKDWHAEFPPAHVDEGNRPYTHVSISWGEREVFLNTPTWADLSPLTVLRILFVGGDSLLHVEHYFQPVPDEDFRPLMLTERQYLSLVERIGQFVVPDLPVASGYRENDAFYTARGHYRVGRTCNQWTSDMLAAAGVRTGWWTPFSGGVMKWVPKPPVANRA